MSSNCKGLNRTFYGIETEVLFQLWKWQISLNRTFYGIETQVIWVLRVDHQMS